MWQQSGENFAPNPMLSSFNTDFALKFGSEDLKQTNKKGLHHKIIGYLITLTQSALLFHRKAFVGPVFGKKFACTLLLVQKCCRSGIQILDRSN